MVTEYHKNVTDGIYEAGKEFLKIKKIGENLIIMKPIKNIY